MEPGTKLRGKVPRKYTQNGEEKTVWEDAGVFAYVMQDKILLRIALFGDTAIHLFVQEDRTQGKGGGDAQPGRSAQGRGRRDEGLEYEAPPPF